MRKIKFRAWDRENKEMLDWEKLKSRMSSGDTYDFSLNSLEYDDEYIFMQFTGLKDKNGKEIYEGDILFQKEPDEMIIDGIKLRGVQSYSEVVWHTGRLDDEYDSYYGEQTCCGFALKNIPGRFIRKVDIDVISVPEIAGRQITDPIIQEGEIVAIFTKDSDSFGIIGNIYENADLLK